jgi:RHS repeat-associated protein
VITTSWPVISATLADPQPASGVQPLSTTLIIDSEVVTPQVNTTSSFAYTPTVRLTEGVHSVTAQVYDQAGNQPQSGPWSFTVVDNAAPSLGITKYYYHGSQRIAMRQDDVVYFIHSDHLGSTSLTTDITGTVLAETRYLPYGEERWITGTRVTDFTFTGQRAETGFRLMDYNARYYDPGLGRFVSADTVVPELGNPQALNRYAYVTNNPIRFVDPTGHQGGPWSKIKKIITDIIQKTRQTRIDWNLRQYTPPAEHGGSVISLGAAGGTAARIPSIGKIGVIEHTSFDLVTNASGQVALYVTKADTPQSGFERRVRRFMGKQDVSHLRGKTAEAIAADRPSAPFMNPQWGWFLTQGVLEGEKIKSDVGAYEGPAIVEAGGGSVVAVGLTGSVTDSYNPVTGSRGEVKGSSGGLEVGLSWPSRGNVGASAANYGTYSVPMMGPFGLGEPGLFICRKLGQCGSGTFDPTPMMRSY